MESKRRATAAHLTDHVLPALPVRQWVLSVPKRLRYFLERNPALQGVALRLFLGAVEQCLRAHCPGCGTHARIGAIAFIHRFGSALNAHLHFHCVVIDGVFAPTPTRAAVFHPANAIDSRALATVQAKVRRRLLASFARRGLLAQDDKRGAKRARQNDAPGPPGQVFRRSPRKRARIRPSAAWSAMRSPSTLARTA